MPSAAPLLPFATRLLLATAGLLMVSVPPVAAGSSPQDAAASAPAQPLTLQQIRLDDGSFSYGTIEEETVQAIVLRTADGRTITVPQSQIDSVRTVTGRMVAGRFRPDDPFNTRLFLSPTARALRRGEGYVAAYQAVTPSVQVGVTNRLSLGIGSPLIMAMAGQGVPIFFTPKVQLTASPRTQTAAGVIHGVYRGSGAGLAYGVVSRSGENGSLTAGAGLLYSGLRSRAVVAMIGGDRPIRRNMTMITDNHLWTSGGVITAGVRRFTPGGTFQEVALGAVVVEGAALPVLVFNFGTRF